MEMQSYWVAVKELSLLNLLEMGEPYELSYMPMKVT